jgi:hypothetical protein
MPDVNPIKAEIRIELTKNDIPETQRQLEALKEIAGSTGSAMGDLGTSVSEGFGQIEQGATSIGGFSDALAALKSPVEEGQKAIAQFSETASASQDAIQQTGTSIQELQGPLESTIPLLQNVSPPMAQIAERAQTMVTQLTPASEGFAQIGESLTQSVPLLPQFAESMHPVAASLQAVNEQIQQTAQAVQGISFTDESGNMVTLPEGMKLAFNDAGNVIGPAASYIQGQLNGVNETAAKTADTMNTMAGAAQKTGTDLVATADGAGASTTQFNVMGTAATDASKAVKSAGSAVQETYRGVGLDAEAMKSISFGEAFGNASAGLMSGLESIAMPLMAVQMIGMAVQAVGQSIYSAAAIAEGPAAHSFGTFTGTVDALGQSAAKTGQQFSEGFGQGMLPALNEMNYEMNQGQQSAGSFGQSLGLATSTLASLWQIGTGQNVGGGLEGLANVGAQIIGVQQPFQGPGPAQQTQIQYQQALANMPQTVRNQASQVQTQADQYLQMASDPSYLASQDQLQASQQAYQHAQATYNSQHYISPQSALMNYQEKQYDTQQMANYQQQMQNPSYGPITPSTFTGYWTPGHLADALIGPQVGDPRAIQGGIGNFFGGIGSGIGGFFGGLGQDWNNLFGSGGGAPSTASMGCFPAGTRVLMGNGSERGIETLQIGEQVQSHDGATTVLALIKPPPKWVYALTFADGNTLTLTASHPVSTTQGWKSLSPNATKKENPALVVTTLHVGDRVHTADGTTCVLESIQVREVVQVYNITVDEPHTFYANNMLVHNKMGAEVGTQVADQVGGIQLPHIDLSGMSSQLGGAFGGIQIPHLDLSGMSAGLAGNFSGIQLPHIDLSGMAAGLGGAFSGISLPHIDLSGISAGLGGAFSGISLPHIDLSGLSSSLAGAFSGISLPSIPDIGSQISSQLGSVFSGISIPSIPEIGGQINSQLSSMFSGITVPSIPEIGGMINGAMSGMFGGITLPSIPDIGGMLNSAMSGIFGGITLPAIPNIGGMLSSAMSGMFSGISLPSIPFFASGVENWQEGGLAVVGDAGPELVRLPSGSSVYPMSAGAGVGGGVSPISFGGSGGSAPQSINLVVQLDSQAILSAIGLPLSQNIRLASGMRGF